MITFEPFSISMSLSEQRAMPLCNLLPTTYEISPTLPFLIVDKTSASWPTAAHSLIWVELVSLFIIKLISRLKILIARMPAINAGKIVQNPTAGKSLRLKYPTIPKNIKKSDIVIGLSNENARRPTLEAKSF